MGFAASGFIRLTTHTMRTALKAKTWWYKSNAGQDHKYFCFCNILRLLICLMIHYLYMYHY